MKQRSGGVKNGGITLRRVFMVAVTVAIGVILGLWQIMPPLPPDEHAAEYPAYQRMMSNIREFAKEPHSCGFAENEVVRARIIAEIESMGLIPVTEDVVYTKSEYIDTQLHYQHSSREEWWEWNHDWIEQAFGTDNINDWLALEDNFLSEDGVLRLQNILVKLDAPETERAVMLVSHYDSAAGAPGAGDDMLSVCAMLEAMRSQAQNGALKNDIYFLFTDGEEHIMLGSTAFVKAHPELKDKVDLVVNLELRGSGGGMLLYETSPRAYPLIETVLRSGARPASFSWAAAIYAMMDNYTDLTAFFEHGYQGINLAAVDGVEHYHKPTDTFDNLSKATARQFLQTTLALSDYAARQSLDELNGSSQDAVYFPFLPSVTVLVGRWAADVFAALACVSTLIFMAARAKRKELRLCFSTVVTGLLIALAIGSVIFFAAASYLFSVPLLAMTVTALLKKWRIAHMIAGMVSGIATLLLWVPMVYLLWVCMIQPMIAA